MCTIVPLSKSEPQEIQAYHYKFQIPFQLPRRWGNAPRWAKCDMICAVGVRRLDVLRLGKDRTGARQDGLSALSSMRFRHMSNMCSRIYAFGLGSE
ncbi:MAG TPA: hypothetical protein DCS45_08325 [Roseovarius nubinhibens]|uniref:Uncharacterized protein n=1 Tax=Roseovarius nubinhibens TaxID=314263 RepID=A0A348WBF3_9RHOB|nr:hypothetical protein [Roseovarius nubinhibens]